MARNWPAVIILSLLILATYTSALKAQVKDSLVHSANRAALYSALLPGLGQAYNKKYWKIPVVYTGFGTLAYFINMNSKEYNKFRDAYDFRYAVENGQPADSSKFNSYAAKYTLASLLNGRDYYRRNRDLTYILTAAWYLLGIVDAAVDAYLFDYDISNELGIRVEPCMMPGYEPASFQGGVHIRLILGKH